MSRVQITPLTPTFAARLSGIDLAQPVAEDDAAAIRDALDRYSVLVFRDQPIDTERQKAVAEIFGQLEATPSRKAVGIEDTVRILDHTVFKRAKDENGPSPDGSDAEGPAAEGTEMAAPAEMGAARDVTKLWHVDDSYFPRIPKVATLRPEVVPEHCGETCWANMAAALASLSPEMQAWLERLEGVNTAPQILREGLNLAAQPKEVREAYEARSVYRHPMVVRHPQSGRKSLFANPMFTTAIDRLSPRESAMMLDYLFEAATRDEFVYRHRWAMGDLVIWDELATIHRGPVEMPKGRRLVRIYAGLVEPVAAAASELAA